MPGPDAPAVETNHVAALLTCFNRRDKTLACLEHLYASANACAGLRLTVHLVDDNSADGTGAAVCAAFPGVDVIAGSGALYWNGGMRLAMSHALATNPGALLWLNDDTMLRPDALARLVALWRAQVDCGAEDVVVVGSTLDPTSGALTYGGRVRSGALKPLNFVLVPPHEKQPIPCDTMNGNCVLLPLAVVKRVGQLDDGFLHSMGDLDYGLRCRRVGIPLLVLPGAVGYCGNDSSSREAKARPDSLRAFWKDVTGFRKCPPKPWWLFCTRHGGMLGPVIYVKPYVSALLRGFLTGRI